MRTLLNLPLVSCQFNFSDGVADIETFRAAAAAADWTSNEINVAVVRAVYESAYFDDVGQMLCRYCSGGRTVIRLADVQASSSALNATTA